MLFFARCEYTEYVETIEKIGSLCTDIFFVIGKTARYHTYTPPMWVFVYKAKSKLIIALVYTDKKCLLA